MPKEMSASYLWSNFNKYERGQEVVVKGTYVKVETGQNLKTALMVRLLKTGEEGKFIYCEFAITPGGTPGSFWKVGKEVTIKGQIEPPWTLENCEVVQ
jgi:hypothetical protein